MSEKDAVQTMKTAREEGRAAPSKVVGLMRDWLKVRQYKKHIQILYDFTDFLV